MGASFYARTRPRREPPRWQAPAVVATIIGALALVAIAIAPPGARPNAIRIVVIVVGLAAALLLLRGTATATRSTPRRFEDILHQDEPDPVVIPGLRAIDQTLRMSTASGFGAAFLLQPLLLELARWRLSRNRRIELDATPEAAREALGEPLWQLIRDRDRTAAWNEPGVRLAEIVTAVDDLERV